MVPATSGVYLVAKKCVQDAWSVSKTVRGVYLGVVADGRDRNLGDEVEIANRPTTCVHDTSGVYLVANKCAQDARGGSQTVRG